MGRTMMSRRKREMMMWQMRLPRTQARPTPRRRWWLAPAPMRLDKLRSRQGLLPQYSTCSWMPEIAGAIAALELGQQKVAGLLWAAHSLTEDQHSSVVLGGYMHGCSSPRGLGDRAPGTRTAPSTYHSRRCNCRRNLRGIPASVDDVSTLLSALCQ